MIRYIRVDEIQINQFLPTGASCTFDIHSPLFDSLKAELIAATATYEDNTGLTPLAL